MSWKGHRSSIPWIVAAITLLFAAGVARANAISKLDTSLSALPTTRGGLCGTPVAVAVDGIGDVYVLTQRGWIYKLSGTDLSSGVADCTKLPQARLPDPAGGGTRPDAIALAVRSNGDVYAGLADGRIYHYSTSLGNNVGNPVTRTGLASLTVDGNGNVYAATTGGTIYKMTSSLATDTPATGTVSAGGGVKVIKAQTSTSGVVALYVMALNGSAQTVVYRLDPSSALSAITQKAAGFFNGTPKNIAADPSGNVVVATSQGLYKTGSGLAYGLLDSKTMTGLVDVDLDNQNHVVAVDSMAVYIINFTTVGTAWGSLSNISITQMVSPPKSIAVTGTASVPSPNSIYVLGGLPGASEGDPHFTTIDGVRYDFQSAGEFVLLRRGEELKRPVSGAAVAGPPYVRDEMEIQVRQFPVATTVNTCVSLNGAVAARVGKHRVTYEPNLSGQPDPSGLQLRIDGKLVVLDSNGIRLGDGGRVIPTSVPGGIELDFPDDTILFVTPGWWGSQGKWYLNLNVVPQESAIGLIGIVPEGSWLPSLPDGTSMGAKPTAAHEQYVELYERFAKAWRVTDKTSLFDYAPGTSTDTFTTRGWPPETGACTIPGTVPVEGATEEVAKEFCKVVPGDPANCIFDVKVTGLTNIANTYVASRSVQPVPETTQPKPRCAGGGTVALLTFLGLLVLWELWSMRRSKWTVLR